MRYTHLLVIVLVLLGGMFLLPKVDLVQAQTTQPTATKTLEERVATLEHKIANVQKFVVIPLDDDAVVDRAITRNRQEQAAMMSSRLVSLLQTVHSQMELYRIQHQDCYPDLLRGWHPMLVTTNSEGKPTKSGEGVGPYLESEPVNPLTDSSTVVSKDKVSAKAGWVYDPQSGALYLVASKEQAANLKLTAKVAVTY